MSNADVVTKNYMRANKIFADAFNYLLYDGRSVIDPDSLRELDSTELAVLFGDTGSGTDKSSFDRDSYKKNAEYIETVQKYRDVLKSAVIKQDDSASYVILGLENQTRVNYAMAVKNIIYDALQYGRQVREIADTHRKSGEGFKGHSSAEFLSGFCKGDRLKPVITLVIHFGADEWDGPLSLHEMIAFEDPTLMKFVPNYPVHLIDPAQLADDEILKFSTSLREVLQYIKYSKDKVKLLDITSDNPRMWIDTDAAHVISAVTDTPFYIPEEAKEVNMCQAIRELMEDSKIEGITEGRLQGLQLAQSMQAWLKEQGRVDDIMRTISDDDFRDRMIEEYRASIL